MLDQKSVLVTGGTGSFGKSFISTLLRRYEPERIIVFSRDELKQHQRSCDPRFCGPNSDKMRYFIGNVRDSQRLHRALDGVDIGVHAAALKQVPLCEYNPFEAIKTNVLGAQNIIEAAIDRGVERVIGPACEIDEIGIRPGEKLHEVMISNNDSRQTLEFDDFYIIEPQFPWWGDTCWSDAGGRAVAEDFRYSSELNSQWLSDRELAAIVEDIDRQTAEQR